MERREILILETLAEEGGSYVPRGPESVRACRQLLTDGMVEESAPHAVFVCVNITPKGERAVLASKMFGGQDD